MGCIISKSGNAAYAPSPVPDPELLRSRHRDVANHGPMGALSDLPRRSAKPLAREDDSASSSRHRPRNALPPHEIPLAGYLVCKTASGAPVEGQAISWLQRSNDTVHETRARFPLGRGNDAADIAATGHASSRHAQAAHDVFVDVVRDGAPRSMLMNPTLMHGAIAEFVQGGHCAGYSAVATTLHAPKLLPGETLHYVQHNLQEHDWVESRLPGAHHDAVVVDAWTRGPAVFASDSRFAGDVRQTQERLVLTAEDGKDMPAQADANAQYLRENYSAQAEAHLERLEAAAISLEKKLGIQERWKITDQLFKVGMFPVEHEFPAWALCKRALSRCAHASHAHLLSFHCSGEAGTVAWGPDPCCRAGH